jgi:hypothetical protein
MFFVPRIAMPHVIHALKAEIGQEQDMIEWVMSDDEDDDWPDGYDPNDLPLFDIVLRTLMEADAREVEEVDLSGKPLAFMFFPLPEYLRNKGATLSTEERRALEDLLGRHSTLQEQMRLKHQKQ